MLHSKRTLDVNFPRSVVRTKRTRACAAIADAASHLACGNKIAAAQRTSPDRPFARDIFNRTFAVTRSDKYDADKAALGSICAIVSFPYGRLLSTLRFHYLSRLFSAAYKEPLLLMCIVDEQSSETIARGVCRIDSVNVDRP